MREYGRRSLTGPAPQPVAFLLCMRRTTRRQNDLTAMQVAATPTARTNAARPCRKFAGISTPPFEIPGRTPKSVCFNGMPHGLDFNTQVFLSGEDFRRQLVLSNYRNYNICGGACQLRSGPVLILGAQAPGKERIKKQRPKGRCISFATKPVSRVLSWTTIFLGCMLPYSSSHLHETRRADAYVSPRCCSE